MKVLLINGSPHEFGTTYRALKEASDTLINEGFETEIICVGNKDISGCVACGSCVYTGKCVKKSGGDFVNEIVDKIAEADGLIIGSPVYYASMNGSLKCLLDRVFYAKRSYKGKPAAAVVAARRAGCVSAFDDINRYFAISEMPIVTSNYWNMIFGIGAEQASSDAEGLQTMRLLAENMAWLIKCIKAGEKVGITVPATQNKTKTNFIKQ